jgi:preprotein translocase subunit SecG
MFYPFIITVHVIVSIFLIFVILLQPGKSDGMAAFSGGGGGSTTAFGGRGSVTFLSKVTTGCAIIFMLTSLTLAYRSSHSDSVLRARRNIAVEEQTKKTEGTVPLAPPGAKDGPAPVTGGAAVPAPPNSATPASQTPAPAPKSPEAPPKK